MKGETLLSATSFPHCFFFEADFEIRIRLASGRHNGRVSAARDVSYRRLTFASGRRGAFSHFLIPAFDTTYRYENMKDLGNSESKSLITYCCESDVRYLHGLQRERRRQRAPNVGVVGRWSWSFPEKIKSLGSRTKNDDVMWVCSF